MRKGRQLKGQRSATRKSDRGINETPCSEGGHSEAKKRRIAVCSVAGQSIGCSRDWHGAHRPVQFLHTSQYLQQSVLANLPESRAEEEPKNDCKHHAPETVTGRHEGCGIYASARNKGRQRRVKHKRVRGKRAQMGSIILGC